MKSIKLFFAAFLLVNVLFTAQAQNASTKAEVIKMFNAVSEAFINGNDTKGWSYYTETATEIGPDGNLSTGKTALQASWDGFMKIVDSRPSFKYTNPAVQVLTPEVAVVTFDSEVDAKIKGQQIGGKTKGIAVVHKINGHWLIEADAITPVMSMPALDAQTSASFTDNKALKAVHDKAMAAFDAQDVKGLVSLFTEDGVHVSPMGDVIKGKEALTKHYTALFAYISKMPKPDRVTSEILNETSQSIAPDAFTTTYNEKFTYSYGSKTQVSEEAHSVLLVKKGNDWKIQNITVTMKGDMPLAVAKN